MKTKTLLLVGLCAIGLCSWEAQAVYTKSIPINNVEMADPPSSYEKIELQGSLMLGINPNAIVAGASDVDFLDRYAFSVQILKRNCETSLFGYQPSAFSNQLRSVQSS